MASIHPSNNSDHNQRFSHGNFRSRLTITGMILPRMEPIAQHIFRYSASCFVFVDFLHQMNPLIDNLLLGYKPRGRVRLRVIWVISFITILMNFYCLHYQITILLFMKKKQKNHCPYTGRFSYEHWCDNRLCLQRLDKGRLKVLQNFVCVYHLVLEWMSFSKPHALLTICSFEKTFSSSAF